VAAYYGVLYIMGNSNEVFAKSKIHPPADPDGPQAKGILGPEDFDKSLIPDISYPIHEWADHLETRLKTYGFNIYHPPTIDKLKPGILGVLPREVFDYVEFEPDDTVSQIIWRLKRRYNPRLQMSEVIISHKTKNTKPFSLKYRDMVRDFLIAVDTPLPENEAKYVAWNVLRYTLPPHFLVSPVVTEIQLSPDNSQLMQIDEMIREYEFRQTMGPWNTPDQQNSASLACPKSQEVHKTPSSDDTIDKLCKAIEIIMDKGDQERKNSQPPAPRVVQQLNTAAALGNNVSAVQQPLIHSTVQQPSVHSAVQQPFIHPQQVSANSQLFMYGSNIAWGGNNHPQYDGKNHQSEHLHDLQDIDNAHPDVNHPYREDIQHAQLLDSHIHWKLPSWPIKMINGMWTIEEHGDAKILLPHSLRRQLLEGTHAQDHLGVRSIYAAVRQNYFWPGMRRDIRNCVKQCDVCSRMKSHPKFRKRSHKFSLAKQFITTCHSLIASLEELITKCSSATNASKCQCYQRESEQVPPAKEPADSKMGGINVPAPEVSTTPLYKEVGCLTEEIPPLVSEIKPIPILEERPVASFIAPAQPRLDQSTYRLTDDQQYDQMTEPANICSKSSFICTQPVIKQDDEGHKGCMEEPPPTPPTFRIYSETDSFTQLGNISQCKSVVSEVHLGQGANVVLPKGGGLCSDPTGPSSDRELALPGSYSSEDEETLVELPSRTSSDAEEDSICAVKAKEPSSATGVINELQNGLDSGISSINLSSGPEANTSEPTRLIGGSKPKKKSFLKKLRNGLSKK